MTAKIVIYPDPVLLQVSSAVAEDRDGLADLVRDMINVMFAGNGAGLAAPQIGVSRRVYVIEAQVAGGHEEDHPLVFVDPEIVEASNETEIAEEGCLSFPGIYVPVKRHFRVRTHARDIHGQPFEIEGEGLFARAMQHELDHLDGRLLIQHVGRIKRQLIRRKMERAAAEDRPG